MPAEFENAQVLNIFPVTVRVPLFHKGLVPENGLQGPLWMTENFPHPCPYTSALYPVSP